MSIKRQLFAAAVLTATLVIGGATPRLRPRDDRPGVGPSGRRNHPRLPVAKRGSQRNVTQLEVDFPTDTPLLGVDVQPTPDWTPKVSELNLNPPVQTDDGPVTQAVSQIIWTAAQGGGIAPGQFQEFHVLVQHLPAKVNQVIFKAIQTYSDGTVVRWIDPVPAAQPNPDHPTPILKLTATTDTGAAASASSSATSNQPAGDTSKLAKSTSVNNAKTIGIVGIIVGALGLIVAIAALVIHVGGLRRRHRPRRRHIHLVNGTVGSG
jgi:periplasmic copper chaperone A